MSTAPHYTGFPLKIRVVSFLFLKHSSSVAWVRLSAVFSHFYLWIIVPYTWHQTLGCLATRPACSSGHCHCSGMHSLSTQRRNMSVTQHSSLSQIPLLKTLLFFTSLCLSAVFVNISIYSGRLQLCSLLLPINLSAHRNTYTQPFILSCSCRLWKLHGVQRFIFISSEINSPLPLYLVWTLGSVPGSPHQRGSYCLFQKRKREKDGQRGKKHRQAELETGSASSQRAEEEKWVEGGRGGKDNRDAWQNTQTDTDILRHFTLKWNNKD